jgi:hypothetical protein
MRRFYDRLIGLEALGSKTAMPNNVTTSRILAYNTDEYRLISQDIFHILQVVRKEIFLGIPAIGGGDRVLRKRR